MSASPSQFSWLWEFHSFSASHAAALVWTLPLIIGSCWLGLRFLRQQDHRAEQRLCRGWGWAVLFMALLSMVYWMLPGRFRWDLSLPCQLCDIAVLVAPFMFLTTWRWPRTMLYFWGIGLSTQAFITPTLEPSYGMQTLGYWLFFGLHTAIVGSAVYDVIVRRYRPNWRDLLLALGITVGWFVSMFFLNQLLGDNANYGYVGPARPDRPTVVDALGPWPQRVLVMAAIGIALFICMWAVWPIGARLRARIGINRAQAI